MLSSYAYLREPSLDTVGVEHSPRDGLVLDHDTMAQVALRLGPDLELVFDQHGCVDRPHLVFG